MSRIYFTEDQKFNQGWLYIVMATASLSALVPLAMAIYTQFVLGKPWGNQPFSNEELLLFSSVILVVLIGANLIVFSSKLEIEVKDDGVYYRYRPMINRWVQIKKETITEYQIKKHHPLKDFGGWGYRMRFFKRVRAFHIKGNMGLALYLSNNKMILLGTQKPDYLRSAMKKMMVPVEDS